MNEWKNFSFPEAGKANCDAVTSAYSISDDGFFLSYVRRIRANFLNSIIISIREIVGLEIFPTFYIGKGYVKVEVRNKSRISKGAFRRIRRKVKESFEEMPNIYFKEGYSIP